MLMNEKYIGKPELVKANDDSSIFICTQCGECCHIRESKNISEAEEASYRKYMYRHYGIIYLAKLSDITINIWPEEKYLLEKYAKDQGIIISIKPKRAIYDESKDRLIILDYFIDHEICPFFDKNTNTCNVYDTRPIICKSYPLTGSDSYGKCEYKKLDIKAYGNEHDEAIKLTEIVRGQKNLINTMIANKEIIIPDSITEDELFEILTTAEIVEMRFDKK
jgi:Fe-S-cluster containining protein